MRRTGLRCALVALGVLVGCASEGLGHWSATHVTGATLEEHMWARTPVVVADLGSQVAITGCAAPITSDGYCLTARFTVTGASRVGGTLEVGLPREDGKCDFRPARAVAFDGGGLALLKVESGTPRFFSWCDPGAVLVGAPIVGRGRGGQKWHEFHGQVTDTKPLVEVLGQDRAPPGLESVMVVHDAPLEPGDGGGPLATPQGGLVGVNAGVIGSFPFRKSIAWRPDFAWLERTIACDRAVHAAAESAMRR